MKIGFIMPSSDYLHDPFRGDPFTHLQILTILANHFGKNIALFYTETSGWENTWPRKLNIMDELWVPSTADAWNTVNSNVKTKSFRVTKDIP